MNPSLVLDLRFERLQNILCGGDANSAADGREEQGQKSERGKLHGGMSREQILQNDKDTHNDRRAKEQMS